MSFWYIVLGIGSILLITLYFVESICESIRTVAMSIGASVLGAVILSVIIEKICLEVLSINCDVSLSHFDEVFKHGRLRSFKYGGNFGITQPTLPTFERNSHVVRQIEAVND